MQYNAIITTLALRSLIAYTYILILVDGIAFYSYKERPSIYPVCLIKMLLVGYLYGIRSERRLEEEFTLNIAYRWFCGFDLMGKILDHSVFSQSRRRRFTDDQIFRDISNHIVMECIEKKLVTGEKMVSAGSFIPANLAWNRRIETAAFVKKSVASYLDDFD